MQFLDNALIVLMIISAFVAGLKLSDHFHKRETENIRYELEKQYARLQAGADHDDACQPYVPRRRFNVPQEFESTFRNNGSATMKVVGE